MTWPFDPLINALKAKPTEKVPYERIPKDGRSSSGFKKPEEKPMLTGNKNQNSMMNQIDQDEKKKR